MSLAQTRVLVNGSWMDLHHILAKNREQNTDEDTDMAAPTPEKPPVVGLLSQTIIRSPVINWIIPARVRHKDKNDVVLIGEHFIHIKELHSDGHLQHVASKTDFHASIRSARVFGIARKPAASGLDAIIKTEEGVDMEIDSPQRALPPQVLLLSLSTRELLFLFALDRDDGGVDFFTSYKPLPEQRSFLEQPGRHLAVDSKSRALAVAAHESSFSIYSLKNMTRLGTEAKLDPDSDGRNFDPILEERHMFVNGIILKMEFLHPPAGDENHVILLLIVHKYGAVASGTIEAAANCNFDRDGKSRLICYDWDASTSLRTVKRLPTDGQRLPKTIYEGILSGAAKRRAIPLETSKDLPRNPGSSRRAPLWTQWARPVRREEYQSRHDDLFLCREDGLVRFLEISDDSEMKVNSQMRAGMLDCNIDTAFASLDLGLDREDLLIAGGDMSVGGLYLFRAREHPEYVESLPNWAPTIDFIADVPPRRNIIDKKQPPLNGNRAFACTGRGAFGALSELRYGLEAHIGSITEAEELGGVNRLWALPDLSQDGLFILLSFPLHSLLLHVSEDAQTIDSDFDDSATGLNLELETLAAAVTPDKTVVQVTESGVHLTKLAYKHNDDKPVKLSHSIEPEERIIAAAVDAKSALVVVVVRSNDGPIRLQLLHCSDGPHGSQELALGQSLRMMSDPTCIEVLRMQQRLFVALGSSTGSVQIFDVGDDLSLKATYEHEFCPRDTPDPFMICESVALLSESIPGTTDHRMLLVCGLRNGQLHAFTIKEDGDDTSLPLSARSSVQLGDTPLKLIPSNSQNFVFFPSFEQSPLSALSQIQSEKHLTRTGLSGSIVCVMGTSLVIAALDDCPKLVPRQFLLNSSPSRIIYSSHLKMLVAASMTIEAKSARHGQGDLGKGRRIIRPVISFVDPDRSSSTSNGESAQPLSASGQSPKIVCKPGEKVLSLLEWWCNENNKSFHAIVIATGTIRQSGARSGRLLFFRVQKKSDGRVESQLKFKIGCDKPVYSVASYGPNVTEKKFTRVCQYNLRSPSVHLSVEAPYIYASTALDSLTILKIEDDKITPQFRCVCSDELARDGMYHLNLNHLSITLATDKACSIVGIWKPPHPRKQTTAPTVFDAELPSSITRLRLISSRHAGLPTPANTPGVLEDRIIGSSADGTFYHFTILEESAWRLLRFIQNMAKRNTKIFPTRRFYRPRKHIEPLMTGKRAFHIDGDVLNCVLDHGVSELHSMLTRQPGLESRFVDFDSAQARRERFNELVRELFGGDIQDPVETAFQYIGYLTQNIF
ncbi:hypothetical protein L228DRAFT_238011 [Xylona heveae TC161]|uniref:Uncharacterized protein n=1 Tax=Xylona heveae (strain CBS 132557 / TC161) TaxID=1328760 RepID=A0A165HFQ8_XYLHT|nr:hypothetical protein L228DRAFT_238011 [Xylona heveae TC161]KZF23443.1 hypothetical protein L228DRAFT_238011 [Xylona heveae TC161]